jgi:hypothetical protein
VGDTALRLAFAAHCCARVALRDGNIAAWLAGINAAAGGGASCAATAARNCAANALININGALAKGYGHHGQQ